ncbi:DsbA family protein [Aeromonas sp. sif2433]|uniref:DsbA family protein n=1 Tax=Aeromonas sp. sif2433 TaxID=2854794 RepID=UPI001C467D76|nr:DsbA family protein [Aeromonas sp. sif2433]MBV7414924.1 DsbA family protein [Aeromonas sp. sif2433]
MSRTLNIAVYFDFICPWCLIGKRQLEQALARLRVERPEVQVAVSWRGVQLLPYLPVQGDDFNSFYQHRLGSAQAVRLRQAQVQQAAASVGLSLDFGNIPRMPNTADAHRLWQRASQLGTAAQQEALLEQLFVAHFQRGADLGDGATLLGLAEAAGFSSAALVSSLQGDGAPFLCDVAGAASQGVPSFVIDEALTLSGAQPAEQLLAALHQALARQAPACGRRIAVPAERVPAPGKRALIEAQGKSLALFNIDGQFHAIDDSCPHQGASLCGGRLEGAVIQCCAHGLRFNLHTGYLLNSDQLRVGRYPVEQEGESLFIVIEPQESIPCTP